MKVITQCAIVLFSALPICSCTNQNPKLVDVPEGEMQRFLADKPEPAKEHFSRVLLEGERNRTLNHMRTSLIALDLNDIENAKIGLDQAIQRIEASHANTKSAKAARSNFKAESTKDFKGESYERAMAYYYRGLLDLIDGDYENARASFESAQLQDNSSIDNKSADFASIEWLAGWASYCRDKEIGPNSAFAAIAEKHFDLAHDLNRNLLPPRRDQGVLAIVEVGGAPKKVALEEGVNIGFKRGRSHAPPNLHVGRQAFRMMEVEDIFEQASTRGRRAVDAVNENKAEFKEKAENAAETSGAIAEGSFGIASALIDVQNTYGFSQDLMNATEFAAVAGLAGSLFSGASSLTSKATKPDADLRYWDNLPDKIYLGTARTGHYPEHLMFSLGSEVKRSFRLEGAPTKTCSLAWVKTLSPLAIPSTTNQSVN